jgi:hypothetical protein
VQVYNRLVRRQCGAEGGSEREHADFEQKVRSACFYDANGEVNDPKGSFDNRNFKIDAN